MVKYVSYFVRCFSLSIYLFLLIIVFDSAILWDIFCAREFRKVFHVFRVFLYFHKFRMFHTFNDVILISFQYLNHFQDVAFSDILSIFLGIQSWHTIFFFNFEFTKCLNFLHLLNYNIFFLNAFSFYVLFLIANRGISENYEN